MGRLTFARDITNGLSTRQVMVTATSPLIPRQSMPISAWPIAT